MTGTHSPYLEQLMDVWPRDLKTYALERFCRSTHHRTAVWVLDVAGAFCFWPKSGTGSAARVSNLASSVSMSLGVSAVPSSYGLSCTIRMLISDDERQRILQEEYKKDISRKRKK